MNALQDAPQAVVLRNPRGALVRHVLCHMIDERKTGWRRFLIDAAAACPVTWWHRGAEPGTVQVALGLTHTGLRMQRELPEHVRRVLHRQAPAFCEGAHQRAAARLGDTGTSSPRTWDKAFDAATLLGVISLFGDDAPLLEQKVQALQALANTCTVSLYPLASELLPAPPGEEEGAWVHFGLRDGISRVALKGWTDGPGSPAAGDTVAAGEALLGEPREHGDNPWQLAHAPACVRELFRWGSFGVLRQVRQHTAAFQAFVQAQADVLEHQWRPGAPVPADWCQLVKAKLSGRFPDGRLIDPRDGVSPIGSVQEPPVALDGQADALGHGCPYGAHVRRMNLRPGQGVVHARRRVLLRRSRPYGSADWKGTDTAGHRGLLGHFFCASLEDQFEHLLGLWADQVPLGLPDGGSAKDPLIGAHDDAAALFEVPRAGAAPVRLSGLAPFVTTRGTLYAFYPGRRGLARLLSERDFADPESDMPVP